MSPGPEAAAAWARRERSVALWLHRGAACRWLLLLLTAASRLGDGVLWVAIGIALPWVSPGGPGTACAIRMAAVGSLNLLIYKTIKHFVARQRPYRCCPGIRACTPALDEYSFPSGHTLHAVAFSFILASYYPGCRDLVWGFTALVALSRVVLGLHFPTDVAMGAAIGLLTAAVSFTLL